MPDVPTDSARSREFAAVFDTPARKDGPPTRLHFRVARSCGARWGSLRRAEMCRVAIEDVSAWAVGGFPHSDL